MRAIVMAHADYKSCNLIGHTRIYHCFTDSKSTSDRNQDIPGNIFSVFTCRKNFSPSHDNGSDRNKEEHIQLHVRKHFFHYRKLTDSSTGNHQDQQNQCKPTFSFSRYRFIIISVSQQHKHGRFSPSGYERVIRHYHQRISFTQDHFFKVVDEPLSVTFLYFFNFGTIVTFKIKLSQSFVDTRETGTKYCLHAVKLIAFFYFFIGHSCIGACIRKQFLRKSKQINNTGYCNKDTHFAQFEHGKSFMTGF